MMRLNLYLLKLKTENKLPTIVKVEPYGDGEFLVTLPNGQKQKYSYENGIVSADVSDS